MKKFKFQINFQIKIKFKLINKRKKNLIYYNNKFLIKIIPIIISPQELIIKKIKLN